MKQEDKKDIAEGLAAFGLGCSGCAVILIVFLAIILWFVWMLVKILQ